MSNVNRRCGDCFYFVPRAGDPLKLGEKPAGTCHRNPPTVSTVAISKQGMVVLQPTTNFAAVTEDSWCGEFTTAQMLEAEEVALQAVLMPPENLFPKKKKRTMWDLKEPSELDLRTTADSVSEPPKGEK